jgi:S1-C subfamily serine protease
MRAAFPLLLVACLVACGPAPRPASPGPASMPASAPASQRTPTGVITRAELLGFLNQPMQTLIVNVVVDRYPSARAKRFRGWRIREFFPGDARFANVDIKPGDVVLRVNGRLLETPDHLNDAWNALKTARVLVVETQRAGKPRTLSWRIVD